MADIFISYSKARIAEASELAGELGDLGYDLWWDTSLVLTGSFGEEIDRHLDAAKAVIVIWSPESVRSKWVRSEVYHADREEKLVNAHTSETCDHSRSIPKPGDITHSVSLDDIRALVGALDRLNVPRSGGVARTVPESAGSVSIKEADDRLFAEVEHRAEKAFLLRMSRPEAFVERHELSESAVLAEHIPPGHQPKAVQAKGRTFWQNIRHKQHSPPETYGPDDDFQMSHS